MAAMPDLSAFPTLATLMTVGRFGLAAYATLATVLTTVCLTLQAITVWDRRGYDRRASGSGASRDDRSLFLRLETEQGPGVDTP